MEIIYNDFIRITSLYSQNIENYSIFCYILFGFPNTSRHKKAKSFSKFYKAISQYCMFLPLCIYHVIKIKRKRKRRRRYQLWKEKKVLNPSNGIFFFAFSATMLQNRQRRKSNIIYYKALSSVFFFTVALISIVLSRATLR